MVVKLSGAVGGVPAAGGEVVKLEVPAEGKAPTFGVEALSCATR
jgi:hypothetical protein